MSEKNNSNSQSEPDTMFNGSNEDYQGFTEGTSNYIKDLARTFSHESKKPEEQGSLNLERCLTSMTDVPGINPYTESIEHAQLDPESPEFNAKFWVKNIRKLYDSDPEYFRHSKLGVAYRNLRAYGIANDVDSHTTVTNYFWKHLAAAARHFRKEDGSRYFDILKPMDAIMRPGDLTVVLGRPGAGCSTLLKALAVNTYGFHLDKQSKISYDGLTQNDIKQHYRGDVIYSAETDVHFPMLTVNETLKFAARLSTPQNRGVGIDRESYVNHITSVYMATYGLLIARNTKVGNAFIQGCSGGERKRVSIAEVSLSGANLQCWDNATRGLDAATALEFIRALKTSSTILEATPIVSLYQCSQDAYDLFDNVLVLYEGYQIFFGSAEKAKQYFIDMGWKCPQRQTTADFLTSLTNPAEREPLPGYENKVPRTAKDFESYWKNSPEYTSLIKEIDEYFQECERLNTKKIYHEDHSAKQSKNLSANSPYTVSFPMQVRYILGRNWLRQKGNPSIPIVSIFAQLIMGLIISSVFYNQPPTTESFYYRGAALFFAVLFNALGSLLEILALFEARQIVEKHKKYALYRPAADAVASIISELPVKFLMSMSFNFVFYFMVNFRREPGRFFFYWFTCMWCMLVMSMLFRCIGSVFTSLPSAMTPASVVLLALIIYTGFVIPVPKMLGWSKWISYINPTYYVFESLMANEFHGRDFTCGVFIPTGPGYQDLSNENRVCSVVGGEPGSLIVSGTKYLQLAYDYHNSHRWRNIGIVIGYTLTLTLAYILLTEINKGAMQKGELVLFLRSSLPTQRKRKQLIQSDIETKTPIQEKLTFKEEFESSSPTPPTPPPSDSMLNKLDSSEIFFWRNLTYEISIKKQPRTILDHIDGWVKPGLVTALMGATGAGKTTLLNCLSERLTVGVITDGKRMVNGHSLDSSFRRSIGYVQQADLHLPTTTVREALQFSAYLRQSKSVSKQEKDKYVDYVIDLLEMNPYADALVGVTGEGLNVEQRKRLSIGVELVAKPKLLLFLDEPTSGLDSQTAWSICKLLRKLADHGQAILCTIHQPSALLMKEFDRLLFLQMGGQTVYFGDLGENCQSLIDYFEKYGADPCPKDANPAEWMLQVVGAAPGSHAKQDYFEVWRNSTEYQEIQNTLDEMERELVKLPRIEDPEAHLKYAVPLWKQYLLVSHRAIILDWRSPNYIYSKFLSTTADALFNGFSFFKADRSLQGLQNQMFSVFMLFPALNIIVQQMLPHYIQQREIFEAREASSRTFSWLAFISGQITSEIPFQVLVGTASFFCWYYPVGFYENAISTDSANQRGVLMWMFLVSFYVYATTLGHLCISFNEIDQNAFILAHLLLAICLMFCGVLAGPDKLPRFWIFMYRCNPFTYLMQGILGTGLADNEVVCADYELVEIQPPSGMSCEAFMGPFVLAAGGYVETEPVSGNCLYCSMSSTNEFLTRINAVFSERWRNWALVVCFIGVNIILAIVFYWLARVPKGSREKKKTITLKDEEE